MTLPNPGSVEAYERGCICPILDNEYGRGRGPWWYNAGCPVHTSIYALVKSTLEEQKGER